ncbi:helix-turn-helix domain-containing protein [Actinotalea sp. M2MS4P-6]|uniref:helix-turn-helix domain-containing protein n=1 Tax=Actinotalea sp. M2MS4P-6 TaxID=2983762 RepID=UPI0021E38B5C|nr:helix-turn-helix domain-containing protein [Actinotalea sp. M2MS4P-6]MCV2396182.1 helix-turn-helix domain-containing protein [Actinotalea sp. M2MS4P-6]
MAASYNVVVDIGRVDPVALDLDPLAELHAVAAGTCYGTLELILTLPAEDLRQAASLGWSVVKAAGHEPQALTVMTIADFDLRWGLDEPATITVREAAELLGVSPQAVRQRLDSGSLPGERRGRDWHLPKRAIERLADES